MTTLAEIKNTPVAGNAHHDRKLFDTIDAFAQDTNNTIADRAESLRWMSDKVMGCGRDEHMSDAFIVQDYLNNI